MAAELLARIGPLPAGVRAVLIQGDGAAEAAFHGQRRGWFVSDLRSDFRVDITRPLAELCSALRPFSEFPRLTFRAGESDAILSF